MASTQKTMSVQAGNASATVRATVNDNMPAIPCPDPAGYKYVGARYVPLFANPLEWNNQTTYEPLTIVIHEGNSYTSKTYVPVGVDIENDDYWALTANYNGQVEQYRQEVSDAMQMFDSMNEQIKQNTDSINKINAKKNVCVTIGNSFNVGYYTHNYGIGDALANMGLFDTVKVYGKDSSSFDNYELNGVTIDKTNNFNSMVNEAAGDSSFNNDDVTTLIFVSAMGDTRALAYKLENNGVDFNALSIENLSSTIANAKSNFPNAKIYIFFAEWQNRWNTSNRYSKYIPFCQLRLDYLFSRQSDAIYLGWGAYPFNFNSSMDKYRMSDEYHPTQEGSKILAAQMANALFGNSWRTGYFQCNNGYLYNGEATNNKYLNFSVYDINSFSSMPIVMSQNSIHEVTGDTTSVESYKSALKSDPITPGTELTNTIYIFDGTLASGTTPGDIPIFPFNRDYVLMQFGANVTKLAGIFPFFDSETSNYYMCFVINDTFTLPNSHIVVHPSYDKGMFDAVLNKPINPL